MEYENKYTPRGQGNLNTVLGAIGTAGATGILNNLGGIFGNNCGKGEDHGVNRYEIGLLQEIAAKDSRIGLLESNIYTDSKIADVYEKLNTKFENRFNIVENQLCEQRVFNATAISNMSCISNQIAQLMALTKIVVPADNVCPTPMPMYNSWAAPTTTTTGA
jgi:hypothetical protein